MPAVLIETAFLTNPERLRAAHVGRLAAEGRPRDRRRHRRYARAYPVPNQPGAVAMIGLFDSGLGGLTVLGAGARTAAVGRPRVLRRSSQRAVRRPHARRSAGLLAARTWRGSTRKASRRSSWPATRRAPSPNATAGPRRARRCSISSNRRRSRSNAADFGASASLRRRPPSAPARTDERFARASPASTSSKSRRRRSSRSSKPEHRRRRPRAAVAEVCAHLPLDLDALIFGCTHYPVLESHFRAVLGAGIALDRSGCHAGRTRCGLLGEPRTGSGRRNTTSGDEAAFLANVARFS